MLRENEALPLPTGIRQSLADVRPALESYIQAAESILNKARVDREQAKAQMPFFTDAFKQLEGKMEAVSDDIEREMKSTHSAAVDSANRGQMGMIVGCIAAIVAVSLIAWRITGSIHKPLATVFEL